MIDNMGMREYVYDMRPWLREHNIEHTYFSGKNVIAFSNDEDASAFMLTFGGTRGHVIDEMREKFTKEAMANRFKL